MGPNEIGNQNNNNNNNVKVHSVLTMVSSTPVNPTGRSCPLTPVDRAMGQHTLHVIFYYRSGSLEFDRIRPSLNEVLTLYPNVTGRLAKDGDGNWQIKFTDAGVRVYLAKVGVSVDEWLRSSGAHDEMNLTVCDDLPDDPQFWSPFRMQVTQFEGGGTAIALSCPHMLADPLTLTLLIKSWTDTFHRNVITHPPFLHPLALKPNPAPAPALPSPSYRALNPVKSDPEPYLKMGSATFSFSNSTINQSLSEFSSKIPDVTPFDLLTALFWTRIAKLKSKSNDSDQKITICMDMRKRLSAPLPCGYFGNVLYFSDLTVVDKDEMKDEMDGMDLGRLTGLVHRHVTGVKEAEFITTVDWLGSRKWDGPIKMYGSELTCVNMEHMIAPVGTHKSESEGEPLMYMARFDKDEKPAHVSYQVENSEGEGLILVMPSPEGGLARRVSVTLPEDEVRKLVQDEVILGLKPIMMLSGGG